jgi:hypothetical protein
MTATSSPAIDTTAIRQNLETTHASFRELIASIPDAKWQAKSGNPGWTVGQLAWHITSGLTFSSQMIENAKKGKQVNIPSFLMPVAYKLNEMRVRRSSRGATKQSVLADYDREQAKLLGLLGGITDDELAVVKSNFGQTRSVREMFHVPVEHFEEHAPEIRAAL